MYLRAGFFSLGLLLLSRVLGLLRETVQAAAFGSSGLGDAVIVMFTLPDLLVGILFSGALAYVLLPVWALQSGVEKQASQKTVTRVLLAGGLLLGGVVWLFRDLMVQALAPGLGASMKALGASSLAWSAGVLPLAMLAALWVTRLQHERDFVGMYTGNLLVNGLLVLALLGVAGSRATDSNRHVMLLGAFLLLAMLARLGWLSWRLARTTAAPKHEPEPEPEPAKPSVDRLAAADNRAQLPQASVWIWAALSSGLLLLLPLMGRSLASQSGEGALANFNYAWKLVELPLVLAIQLVASLAFPAITRTTAGSQARQESLQVAFLLAWMLACAAIAIVATFSLPLASLLFGWGRMSAASLLTIAHWSAIGVWSLLPQALIAVLLTVMAISQQMHVAVAAYVIGIVALGLAAWAGLADGAMVMWALNGILAGVAVLLLVSQGRSLRGALPWPAMLLALLTCAALVLCKPWFANLSLLWVLPVCAMFALLVGASALANPLLRRKLGLSQRMLQSFTQP